MRNLVCILLSAVILCSSLLSGCATLIEPDAQNVTFASSPDGAEIRVGPYSCETPCTLRIPAGKKYDIVARYDGQTRRVPLERSFSGWTVLNIVFWPGFIVDVITGKMFRYNPDYYEFEFSEPEQQQQQQ